MSLDIINKEVYYVFAFGFLFILINDSTFPIKLSFQQATHEYYSLLFDNDGLFIYYKRIAYTVKNFIRFL